MKFGCLYSNKTYNVWNPVVGFVIQFANTLGLVVLQGNLSLFWRKREEIGDGYLLGQSCGCHRCLPPDIFSNL